MVEFFGFLISGIIFGLVAGISPGPLLALVISETVKHNKKEGIIIAIAPIITDVPIVLLSLFVLTKLSGFNIVMGSVSVLGALFIGYLAYESISLKGIRLELDRVRTRSFRKGIITNFLSPHPYMFWALVGSPIVLKAYSISLISAFSFILGFYFLLVGSKIMVAVIVEKSKSFLKSDAYIYVIRFLGLVLLAFAFLFAKEGLKLFGLV